MNPVDEARLQEENQQLRKRNAELEELLRQAEVQRTNLENLYSRAPVGLGLVDTELRYVGVNQRLAEFNGFTVEQHVGAHLSEIVPQIFEAVEPIFRRVIETGEPELGFEVSGVSPLAPTQLSMFLVSYFPVKDKTGVVTGVSVVVQDTTEQSQAEDALRESEQQVRLLLHSTAEAIYGLDLDGNCTFCNPACTRILGYQHQQQLLGKNMHELIHHTRPDGTAYPRGECRIYESFRSGKGVHVDDEVLWRADGTSFPAEYWSYPIHQENNVVGAVTTFLDISERREAEQALLKARDELEERVQQRTAELSRSEERWRSVFDTAPDIILIIDSEGTIQYINRTEHGYTQEDVIGTCAYDYTAPEERPAMIAAHQSVMETGESISFEVSTKGADESVSWYQSRIGPFREDGKIVGVISIATDITRRKQAEQRLKAEQQLLRRLLTLQENERRMVAHDIHDGFVQDVVGAHMCVQSVANRIADHNGVGSTMEDIEQLLSKGITEGRRLIRDLRPMVLDESGVVEALTHLFAEEAKNKELMVAFEHDVRFDRLEPMLEGAIFRIVQESINNVRQHAQVRQASVQMRESSSTLQVVIQDRGVGFDPQQVEPERFGLRGIRERARLFGGSATIESTIGKGTSIEVQLPLSPLPDAPIS